MRPRYQSIHRLRPIGRDRHRIGQHRDKPPLPAKSTLPRSLPPPIHNRYPQSQCRLLTHRRQRFPRLRCRRLWRCQRATTDEHRPLQRPNRMPVSDSGEEARPQARMKFKQFLQNLSERLGIAETPALPPQAVDMPLADPRQLQGILPRLAAWGVKQIHWIAGDSSDESDLIAAIEQTARLGMKPCVRGRASDFASEAMLANLVSAGAAEFEILFLSAIAEVHDALAGGGDYHTALHTLAWLTARNVEAIAQFPLVPSTWKTIARTVEFLGHHGIQSIRISAVICRDDEPSSWALSTSALLVAIDSIKNVPSCGMECTWYPPTRFDPTRTLAQQVRRGPRSLSNSLRIEPDGRVLLPIGPADPAGNLLRDEWKTMARSVKYQDWLRRREAAKSCSVCLPLATCNPGCICDPAQWSEGDLC